MWTAYWEIGPSVVLFAETEEDKESAESEAKWITDSNANLVRMGAPSRENFLKIEWTE